MLMHLTCHNVMKIHYIKIKYYYKEILMNLRYLLSVGQYVNFAVPCMTSLRNAFNDYKIDTLRPGIIKNSLDAFCDTNKNNYAKMALDGKKIRVGQI